MKFPTGVKVIFIVALFISISLLLTGVIRLQGSVFDGVRSYVRGEGLWAKAQKDAVFYLNRYSYTHAESDYAAFRESVQVTLGDKQARKALQASPSNLAQAREGFLRGLNHPSDIEAMIWFFLNFRQMAYMHEAIVTWQAGDEKIDDLIALGNDIQTETTSGGLHPQHLAALRQRLEVLNGDLMRLENHFSLVLSEGARWVRNTTWILSLSMLALLMAIAATVSRQIIRGIALSEDQMKLAATVFGASSDGILITDPGMRVISANQALCVMSGYDPHDFEGHVPKILQPDEHEDAHRKMLADLQAHGHWQGETICHRKNALPLPIRLSISQVRNHTGSITHYVAILTDITERKENEELLRHTAWHDPLTGLPNRVLLNDRIERAVKHAERKRSSFAILFFDLDDFKPVNDRYGHLVGDKLLQIVADRLSSTVRDADTVSRIGGDEFVVLLENVVIRDKVDKILAKTTDAVCAPCHIDGHDITIHVSVGVGFYPENGSSIEDVLDHADTAMYAMKQAKKQQR